MILSLLFFICSRYTYRHPSRVVDSFPGNSAWEIGIGEMTYFVALPFPRTDHGELVVGEAISPPDGSPPAHC
jgi:hypothetical protein